MNPTIKAVTERANAAWRPILGGGADVTRPTPGGDRLRLSEWEDDIYLTALAVRVIGETPSHHHPLWSVRFGCSTPLAVIVNAVEAALGEAGIPDPRCCQRYGASRHRPHTVSDDGTCVWCDQRVEGPRCPVCDNFPDADGYCTESGCANEGKTTQTESEVPE